MQRGKSKSARLDRTADAPVVIVGMGPVGLRLAQELLDRGLDRELILYGNEPWAPYDRVRLSGVLSGAVSREALAIPLRFGAQHRVVERTNCPVVAVDTARRELTDADGRAQAYSDLILAVGSRPHVPNIPGILMPGVFTLRGLSDVERLLARSTRTRRTVVLGGGLLGLEAARALQRGNTEVVVVEHTPRLMGSQLDQQGAELLREYLLGLGIAVQLANGVSRVLGRERVDGVLLRDGRMIRCDTIVLATGIRANVDLARKAGLRVGRGVQVDDKLRASAPHTYAVGECAEHRGRLYGLVAPGFEQAAVLAERLTGGRARYRGSTSAAHLKVVGKHVFSMGECGAEETPRNGREARYTDSSAGVYRKLVLRRGRLVGAVAVGEWPELPRIQQFLADRRPIWPWQLRRLVQRGRLWRSATATSVAQWPAQTTVCNCTGVRRGELGRAIAGGCTTVEALSARTRAGSVCGTCRPLLAELVGAELASVPAQGRRSLTWAAVVAALACIAFVLSPPPAAAASVQDLWYQISVVWRDGLWKQVSGFTLLGMTVLGALMSLRKRWPRFQWGAFGHWRALHGMLGALTLVLVYAHTGLQAGEQLNAYLLADFLAIGILGAVAGFVAVQANVGQGTRRWLNRIHLWLAWPLPALIGFHVLSVYYF